MVRPPPSSVCRAPRAALEGRTVPLGAVLCGSGRPLGATEGGGRGTTTRPASVCKRCNHGAWEGKAPSYPRKNQIILPPQDGICCTLRLQPILLGSLALPSTPVVPPFFAFLLFSQVWLCLALSIELQQRQTTPSPRVGFVHEPTQGRLDLRGTG